MKAQIKRVDTAVIGGKTYIMLEPNNYSDLHAFKRFATEMKPDKVYTVDVKLYRKKRSNDANRYLWQLLGQMAIAMTTEENVYTDTDIYIEEIRKVGDYEILSIPEYSLDKFKQVWGNNGLGWPVEKIDNDTRPGFILVAAYYGSSTYNSKQMSRLIDNVVQDCKVLGIETMTPEELSRLKEEWNAPEDKGVSDKQGG